MQVRHVSIEVSPSIGKVSGEYVVPADPVFVMTLAHGAGAGMNHPFMTSLSTALADHRIATLRFNFPFSEQKKSRPDVPAVAHRTIAAAIDNAHHTFSGLPLFASGKSFGGRMTSQLMAADPQAHVRGIIFYGFPLHAPGKPGTERADHLKQVMVPMLFLQGTKDELATFSLIESVCAALPMATLVKFDGANHAFKAGKQNLVPLLADATRDWIVSLGGK